MHADKPHQLAMMWIQTDGDYDYYNINMIWLNTICGQVKEVAKNKIKKLESSDVWWLGKNI